MNIPQTALLACIAIGYTTAAHAQSYSPTQCNHTRSDDKSLYIVIDTDDHSNGWFWVPTECELRSYDGNMSQGILERNGVSVHSSNEVTLRSGFELARFTFVAKGDGAVLDIFTIPMDRDVAGTWVAIDGEDRIIDPQKIYVDIATFTSSNQLNTVSQRFLRRYGFLVNPEMIRVTEGTDPIQSGIKPSQDHCASVGGGKYWNDYTKESNCNDSTPGNPIETPSTEGLIFPFGENALNGRPVAFCAPGEDRWGDLREWLYPDQTCFGSGYEPVEVATVDPSHSGDEFLISWPVQYGWMQIQNAETYETICEGRRSCTVPRGVTVHIINHTTGTRDNHVLIESNITLG